MPLFLSLFPKRQIAMLRFCASVCCAMLAGLCGPVDAATPVPKNELPKPIAQNTVQNAVPGLLRQMEGMWNVQQRMWPKLGATAVNLPPAVAKRRLTNQVFLEETMEAAEKTGPKAFTRTVLFNYNAVNRQYEYVSLDCRAPQVMNEKSRRGEISPPHSDLTLDGGTFVAPEWGGYKNTTFQYRLTVGAIVQDRQIVRLFLTPQTHAGGREFLAFEYVYTRQK